MSLFQPAILPPSANLLNLIPTGGPAGPAAGESSGKMNFAAQFFALLGTLGTGMVKPEHALFLDQPGDSALQKSEQTLELRSAPAKSSALPSGKLLPDSPEIAVEARDSVSKAPKAEGSIAPVDDRAAEVPEIAQTLLPVALTLLRAGPVATRRIESSTTEAGLPPAPLPASTVAIAAAGIARSLLAKVPHSEQAIEADASSSARKGAQPIAIPVAALLPPALGEATKPKLVATRPGPVPPPELVLNTLQSDAIAPDVAADKAPPGVVPRPQLFPTPPPISETGLRARAAHDARRTAPAETLEPAAKIDLMETESGILPRDHRLLAASAVQAQPAQSAAPAGAITAPAATHSAAPHDFAALVDRLVEARQAAQAGSPNQTVTTAINHTEFGHLSLQFQHDDAGLSVTLASSDPDLARAIQAAAPGSQSATYGDQSATPRQDSGGQTHPQSQAQSQAQSQSQLPQQQRGQPAPGAAAERHGAANPDPRRSQPDAPPKRDGIFA